MSALSGIRLKSPAHGVPMDTLTRMQISYDIAQARKREGEINVAPFTGKPNDPQPDPRSHY